MAAATKDSCAMRRILLFCVAALSTSMAGSTPQVSVKMTSLLEEVVMGSKDQQMVLFSFTAPKAMEAASQDLVVVLDISLSMAEQGKLQLAKMAITKIINALRDSDRFHLVSFHGSARIEVEGGSISNKAQILQILDSLHPSTTSVSRPATGGEPVQKEVTDLIPALNLVKRLHVGPPGLPIPGATRRAMLFSDGKFAGGMKTSMEIIQVVEDLQLEGAITSVVGLGQGLDYGRWLLETIAETGRGDFIHLSNTQILSKVETMGTPGYFQTVATSGELRIWCESGAEVVQTSGHRRRGGHRRRMVSGKLGWTRAKEETVPIGTIRTGRSERLLVELALPGFLRQGKYTSLLTYEFHFDEAASSGLIVRDQLKLDVLSPGSVAAAPYRGALLYHQFSKLLLELEELRIDEEAAEAFNLPAAGKRGDGSSWARVSERWAKLRNELTDFAAEAAAGERQLPSVAEMHLARRAWSLLETTKTAGRSSDDKAAFSVCEGTPPQQAAPRGIEGLGL